MSNAKTGARWEREAELALGGEIIRRAGIADYQGWLVLAAKYFGDEARTGYGVLSIAYGSCNVCDQWEGRPMGDILKEMRDSIVYFASEKDALRYFEDHEGW